MQGLQRTDVIAQKYDNQKKLAEYAAENKSFNEYQSLFKKNEDLYARKFALALLERFPTTHYRVHNFGILLSPDHLRRKFSR